MNISRQADFLFGITEFHKRRSFLLNKGNITVPCAYYTTFSRKVQSKSSKTTKDLFLAVLFASICCGFPGFWALRTCFSSQK